MCQACSNVGSPCRVRAAQFTIFDWCRPEKECHTYAEFISFFFFFSFFSTCRHSIYESAPWSMEAWSRPLENAPLASTRLAGTGNNSTVNSNSVNIVVVQCTLSSEWICIFREQISLEWPGMCASVCLRCRVFGLLFVRICPKYFALFGLTASTGPIGMHLSFVYIYSSEPPFRCKQSQSTIFCVRCGTPRGIITHWLRSETHRDMAAWARSLVQGTHNAINYQREFSFRCVFQVRRIS